MDNRLLYTSLAVAGATPFVACALLPLLGIDAAAPFGRLDVLIGSYGLAILSFLAGAHWATYLYRTSEAPFNLLISSDVVLLAVWLTFVLASLAWILVVQLIAFAFLLLVDYRFMHIGLISRPYLFARSVATAMAMLSLATIVLT